MDLLSDSAIVLWVGYFPMVVGLPWLAWGGEPANRSDRSLQMVVILFAGLATGAAVGLQQAPGGSGHGPLGGLFTGLNFAVSLVYGVIGLVLSLVAGGIVFHLTDGLPVRWVSAVIMLGSLVLVLQLFS